MNLLPKSAMNLLARIQTRGVSNTHVWTCLLIVVFGLFVRTWGIHERSVFDYDEAWYLLEAKSLNDAAVYAAGRITGDDAARGVSLKTYLHERGTVPITSLKPGHNLLMFLSYLLFGVSDTAGLFVSAFLGILTIGIVYRVAQELFDDHTALLSSAVLAASGFHIIYSRSALAQADSAFFVALGLHYWIKARSSHRRLLILFFSGMCVGYGVTCHYNAIMAPVILVGLEGAISLREKRSIEGLLPAATLGIGIMAPILAFELSGQLIKLAAGNPEGLHTYFEQYAVRDTDRMANDIKFYPYAAVIVTSKLLFTEGALVLFAATLGMSLLLATEYRNTEVLALCATAAGPIVFWSLFSVDTDVRFRVMPIAFPSLAVVTGYGVSRILTVITSRFRLPFSATTVAVVVLLLITGTNRSWPLVHTKAGYREAIDQLVARVEQHGGTIGFRPGSTWPTWNFYLSCHYDRASDDLRAKILPYTQQDEFVLKGDYDPLDFRRYFRAIHLNDRELINYLESRGDASEPVITLDNPFTRINPYYLDTNGLQNARTLARIRGDYPEAHQIRIYDVRNEGPQIAEVIR